MQFVEIFANTGDGTNDKNVDFAQSDSKATCEGPYLTVFSLHYWYDTTVSQSHYCVHILYVQASSKCRKLSPLKIKPSFLSDFERSNH